MGTVVTPESHICRDDRGRPCITGTSYRVLDVVADHVVHGFSPAEIQYQHYHELSLAQVHAALTYYYDHRAALDEALREEVAAGERLRPAGESPVVARRRALLGR